ncbi:MAG: nitrous oxide reductase family maturation protein NosD [Acidimicrobiia bacterium]
MRRAAAAALVLVGFLVSPASASAARGTPTVQQLVDRAAPGAVVHVPSGTYRERLVIRKPVSLLAAGHVVVDGGGRGTVMTVEAPDVRIQGFEIRNSGESHNTEDAGIMVLAPRARLVGNHLVDVLFGIEMRGAEDSLVRGNVIGAKNLSAGLKGDPLKLWECSRTVVERNRVESGRDVVLWYSDRLLVRDNLVRHGRYGLHFMYADHVRIERNWLEGNSTGAYLMYGKNMRMLDNVVVGSRGPSGFGLGIKDAYQVQVRGNRLVNNRVGIYFDSSPETAAAAQPFRNNVIAYNDIGMVFFPAAEGYAFADNAFVDNRQQIALNGGGKVVGNHWSIGGRGNHWSEYAGYDANGNGIGDVPYKAQSLFSDLTDRNPELTLFSDTPAARAIDLAARAFPSLRPDPVVTDNHPLVAMPPIPGMPREAQTPSSTGLLLASLGLVALAALVIGGARPWRAFHRPASTAVAS